MTLADLEQELITLLRCLRCHSALLPIEAGATCSRCQTQYAPTEGIWPMLTVEQAAHYQPFLAHYQPLRKAEGWERDEAAYYLNLPYVKSGDPHEFVWRIRQSSWQKVQTLLPPGEGRWCLDLGAGNGWLSRRLVQKGYKVVAVDLNTTGPDSLAGGILYQQHDNIWFGRVQSGMEDLPFQNAVFNLCIASGSLHYAALAPTLTEIRRVLAPGGMFILTDSPIYQDPAAGEAMAAEYLQKVRQQFDRAAEWVGGSGSLVESQLLHQLRSLNFTVHIHPIEHLLGRLKHVLLSPFRNREHARFPVITATKKF